MPDPTQLIEWTHTPWARALIFFVLYAAMFRLFRKVILVAVRRLVARTAWSWDDLLVGALSTPLLIFLFGTGILIASRIAPLDPDWDHGFNVFFAFCTSLAFVLLIDRMTRGILDRIAPHSMLLQGSRGLIQGCLSGLFIGIGVLVFLDSIGVSITPILASLGVGSLAVALALQDTLANLFAGIYMIADKPVEPGQMVRLPTGEEGYVAKVGWRSTWIRLAQNSMLIIPNGKLAGGVIVNYDLPLPELAVTVSVGVDYRSDLPKVEQVTVEVARQVQETVEGGVRNAEPILRFIGFGD